MLRRVASCLFWTARNLERAEWRARLADVNYHLLVDSPLETEEGWLPLLAISGDLEQFKERYPVADEKSALEFFTIDEKNPTSIRSCIGFARENCRSLRNHISSEMWLEVNTLYLDAQKWSAETFQQLGVYEFFFELRERFYRISGVIQNTTRRNIGYDFLAVGKALEAAENVTRLLDVKYHFLLPHPDDVGSPLDLSQWTAVLRSASAFESYIETYGNLIRIENVVEFLLFDETFPRAARFSIERLDAALERVAAAGGSEGNRRIHAARDLASNLRSGSAHEAIEHGLHEYLLNVQDCCAKVSDEIFEKYLRFE